MHSPRAAILPAWFVVCCAVSCMKGPIERRSRQGVDSDAPSPGVSPQAAESPDSARARLEDYPWMSQQQWCRRHEAILKDPARRSAKLVFLGDSITQGWLERAKKTWQEHFSKYRPMVMGIGGDQTQNVLWRIEHGELDGIEPDDLVLLVGINNLDRGGFGAEETARGVEAVVSKITDKLPHTRILLMALLPTGRQAPDPLARKIRETNHRLQTVAQARGLAFVDVSARFATADGSIQRGLMLDDLHPSSEGYEILATEIERLLTPSFKGSAP